MPVIKASGLAAGKGVLLPIAVRTAEDALAQSCWIASLATRALSSSKHLVGPELSVLAFCDGKNLRILPAARPHKRLLDEDKGPNTGGMGALHPPRFMTPTLKALVSAKSSTRRCVA